MSFGLFGFAGLTFEFVLVLCCWIGSFGLIVIGFVLLGGVVVEFGWLLALGMCFSCLDIRLLWCLVKIGVF